MAYQTPIRPKRSARAFSLLRHIRNAFFIVGFAALSYYAYVFADAKIYQHNEAQQFERSIVGTGSASPANLGGPPATLPPRGSFTSQPAALRTMVPAIPANSPLGEIEISKIGVDAIIVQGTDDRTLRRAVGHIETTALPGQPGNIAIAGHRDTFFRNLQKLDKDDAITLRTVNRTYRYVVDSSEIVNPSNTKVLSASNNSILTLVTCYPPNYIGPAPKRLVVHAHLSPDTAH